MSSFDNVFCTDVEPDSPYHIIQGETTNDYESKVVQTYCEDPERWRKAIGDTLLFQFGVLALHTCSLGGIQQINVM
uniref:hypothetical protein n=1 Tax=Photorhabdus sp. CRCIA-P01 TaxID=2019570 RepID=UPI001E541903|nr:hypothetical protein [Photorhabdus sp. CRCIA-P01]